MELNLNKNLTEFLQGFKNKFEPYKHEKAETCNSDADNWLEELYRLKHLMPPFYYFNNKLGSPKFSNGVLKCFEDGMTPKEALEYWRNYA